MTLDDPVRLWLSYFYYARGKLCDSKLAVGVISLILEL